MKSSEADSAATVLLLGGTVLLGAMQAPQEGVPTQRVAVEPWWHSEDSDSACDEDAASSSGSGDDSAHRRRTDAPSTAAARRQGRHRHRSGGGNAAARATASQDELYDPDADDEDDAWAAAARQGRQTDAILSCPGCFTTLSVDCQQHAHYRTRYRALFVMNVCIQQDGEVQTALHSDGGGQAGGKRRRHQQRQTGAVAEATHHRRPRRAGGGSGSGGAGDALDSDGENDDASDGKGSDECMSEEASAGAGGEAERLTPVACAVCGTRVGAQDADEVVHFFHVLASE